MNRKILVVAGLSANLLLLLAWIVGGGRALSSQTAVLPTTVTSPVTISNSPNDATRPTIALGGNGTLYVAWEQGEAGGQTNPYYSTSANGGNNWATPAAIYNSGVDSLRPVIATNTTFGVQVVWDEGDVFSHLAYQKMLTATAVITAPPTINLAPSAHDIAVDNNSNLHLVVQGNTSPSQSTPYHVLYSWKSSSASVWPQATRVYTNTSSGTGSQYPAIAIDSQGARHVVWQQNKSTTDGVIYYSKGAGSGTISWTAPVTISVGVGTTNAVRPAIAVDGNDVIHVTWVDHVTRDEQYVYYAHSVNGGVSWSTPMRVVSQAVGANVSPLYVSPVIAVANGNLYIAWHDNLNDPTNAEDIYLTFSEDQGNTWASPINISRSGGAQSLYPRIVPEVGGIVHVVWQEQVNGVWEIQYAHTVWLVYLPMISKSP